MIVTINTLLMNLFLKISILYVLRKVMLNSQLWAKALVPLSFTNPSINAGVFQNQ